MEQRSSESTEKLSRGEDEQWSRDAVEQWILTECGAEEPGCTWTRGAVEQRCSGAVEHWEIFSVFCLELRSLWSAKMS
jgi:hypothetical protein